MTAAKHTRTARFALLLTGAALVLPGCSAIRESRGYIIDPTLTELVQPQIDNKRSVESTLGRPTFTSRILRRMPCDPTFFGI